LLTNIQKLPLALLALLMIAFVSQATAAPQAAGHCECRQARVRQKDPKEMAEVYSLYRQASELIPAIEKQLDSRTGTGTNIGTEAMQIVSLQVHAGDLEGALATAQKPSAPGDQGAVIFTIVDELSQQGNISLALSFIETIPKGVSRTNQYELIERQLARKGDLAGALRIAHLIGKEDTGAATFVADLVDLSARQSQAHNPHAAAKTLDEALAAVERTLRKLQDSDPDSFMVQDPDLDYFAIEDLYQCISSRISETQNRDKQNIAPVIVDRISEMAEREKDFHWKQVLLSYLASAQAEIGNVPAALETAARLRRGTAHDLALERIQKKQVDKDDLDGARNTAEAMSPGELRYSALQEIVSQQVIANDFDAALRTAEDLPLDVYRESVLQGIVAGQVDQGDFDGARRTAEKLPSGLVRDTVQRALARVDANRQDPNGPAQQATDTSEDLPRPSFLRMLADEYGSVANDTQNPISPPGPEASSEATPDAKSKIDPDVLKDRIRKRADLGDLEGAIALLAQLDDLQRSWPLQHLTYSLVKAGKKKEAIELTQSQDAPLAKAKCLLGIGQAVEEEIDINHIRARTKGGELKANDLHKN
jgi:hypothetical protein